LGVLSGKVLYRLTVSGYVAHVAGKVDLAKVEQATPIAIVDRSIAANSGGYGHILSLWNYPAGGKAAKHLARFEYGARGLTISARSTGQRRESP
jgi:N-methylhydantoinase B/oxoprolinase/acetone carboxylase alpha subunit